jgi:hypothetical protein
MDGWRNVGNNHGCFERRFTTGKVGHVHLVEKEWKAFFDGNCVGASGTESLAMILVTQYAKERNHV